MSRAIACGFFFAFAKFEYALKLNHFLNNPQDGNEARASIDSFLDEIWTDRLLAELANAAPELSRKPPRKLVTMFSGENIKLKWVENDLAMRTSGDWSGAIRALRNNFFHGNKSESILGGNGSRDQTLLREGKTVIEILVRQNEEVQRIYDGQ